MTSPAFEGLRSWCDPPNGAEVSSPHFADLRQELHTPLSASGSRSAMPGYIRCAESVCERERERERETCLLACFHA